MSSVRPHVVAPSTRRSFLAGLGVGAAALAIPQTLRAAPTMYRRLMQNPALPQVSWQATLGSTYHFFVDDPMVIGNHALFALGNYHNQGLNVNGQYSLAFHLMDLRSGAAYNLFNVAPFQKWGFAGPVAGIRGLGYFHGLLFGAYPLFLYREKTAVGTVGYRGVLTDGAQFLHLDDNLVRSFFGSTNLDTQFAQLEATDLQRIGNQTTPTLPAVKGHTYVFDNNGGLGGNTPLKLLDRNQTAVWQQTAPQLYNLGVVYGNPRFVKTPSQKVLVYGQGSGEVALIEPGSYLPL